MIAYMVSTFANSSNPNSRKGGLIGLVAIAIGLGGDVFTYLPLICPPVLRCFTDQDSRVRYYACESLYNVAKVLPCPFHSPSFLLITIIAQYCTACSLLLLTR